MSGGGSSSVTGGTVDRPDCPHEGMRLLLAEDHPHVRREFVGAFQEAFPTAQALATKDLPEALEALERWQPTLVVVDLGLPSGSGLNLLRSATMLLGVQCQSLLLTVTGNDEFLIRAVQCGACGAIYKSDAPSVWWGTITEVLEGGSPANAAVAQAALESRPLVGAPAGPPRLTSGTRAVAEFVASGYSLAEVSDQTGQGRTTIAKSMRTLYESLREPLPRLTARELELIRLLGKGNGFKQCAALMGVGEATTKTLATRAYGKLGASNLQTALYEARTLGLLV